MKVSIIVATHDRASALARLLHSLSAQAAAGEHEILIADNGTPQPSPVPAGVPVAHHIHDAAPGKCRVQNRAIGLARGEIIAMLDDDVTAESGYLEALERFFCGHPEFAAMKGKVLPAQDPARIAGENWPYMDLPMVDHGPEVREVGGVLGANMAFRAAVFAQIGAFDERLGPGAAGHEEDTEFSKRLRTAGLRIGYCPGALVYHEVDPARADRARFIRVARERGRCRMMHERRGLPELLAGVVYAGLRMRLAHALSATAQRRAREDRRFATALGMLDGFKRPKDR